MRIYYFFYIFILYTSIIVAKPKFNTRQPAVENVYGLSIEEYKQTTHDKGYNWRQPQSIHSSTKDINPTKNTKFPYWSLMLLLPLSSFFIFKKLAKKDIIYNKKIQTILTKEDNNNRDDDNDNMPIAS